MKPKASLLVLAVVIAFAITACEEAPVAPPDPLTKPEPPDTFFPPELDTRPVFERRVDRIEVPIPPPGTNALNLPVITPLPGARGGNGALVYTAEGLPGDFEIVFGRDLMVVLPGRGGLDESGWPAERCRCRRVPDHLHGPRQRREPDGRGLGRHALRARHLRHPAGRPAARRATQLPVPAGGG